MPRRRVDPPPPLRTPALLVHESCVRRNAVAMRERAQRLGVSLRPHCKTHKTIEIARILLEGVPEDEQKITVSTLAEAEYFADGGFQDILFAVPLAPTVDQLDRIRALMLRVPRFHVLVDSAHAISQLQADAQFNDVEYSAFLKIDTGYGRFGVLPESPEAMAFAQSLTEGEGTTFAGLYSHSGHAYAETTPEGVIVVAEEERSRSAALAERLAEAGCAPPTVSVGSTPACVHSLSWEGCTEIHPGNYCFFDLQQVSISSCEPAQIAATVLTTVLSHSAAKNQVMVDAGGTALHKDRAGLGSWGAVVDHPELTLSRISQECGVLTPTTEGEAIDFEQFPVGSQLRLQPNHSCMTAGGFAKYHLVNASMEVQAELEPAKGW